MEANYFTKVYWFCHTLTWIRHGCTRVPHPEPPSHLTPRTIPLGHRSAPAPSIQYHALNLDWLFISYMILYMFQCHSPKSSHPIPLPQNPKDCSIHLCLFCCLAYSVIITIFLNSIYIDSINICPRKTNVKRQMIKISFYGWWYFYLPNLKIAFYNKVDTESDFQLYSYQRPYVTWSSKQLHCFTKE